MIDPSLITLHVKLAWALAGYLERSGYEVTHLLSPNPIKLPAPPPKGTYEPDLLATKPDGVRAIGLAVTDDDLPVHSTYVKLIDFATRYDTQSKRLLEFYVGVPDDDDIVQAVKHFYNEQGVRKDKANIRIVRLDLGAVTRYSSLE
jgi:hypothetical protein